MELGQAASSGTELTGGMSSSGVTGAGAGLLSGSTSQTNVAQAASVALRQSQGAATEKIETGKARLTSTQAKPPASANDRIAVTASAEEKLKSESSKTDEKKTVSKAANGSSEVSQGTLSNALPSSTQIVTAVSQSLASSEGAIQAAQAASPSTTLTASGSIDVADSVLSQGGGRTNLSTQSTQKDASAAKVKLSEGGVSTNAAGADPTLAAPQQSSAERSDAKSVNQSAVSDPVLASNPDSAVASSQSQLQSIHPGQSDLQGAEDQLTATSVIQPSQSQVLVEHSRQNASQASGLGLSGKLVESASQAGAETSQNVALTADSAQGASQISASTVSLTQEATPTSGSILAQGVDAEPSASLAETGNSNTAQSAGVHEGRSEAQKATVSLGAVQEKVATTGTAQSVAATAKEFTANPPDSGSSIAASQSTASVQTASAGTVRIEAKSTAPIRLTVQSESTAEAAVNQTAQQLHPGQSPTVASGLTQGVASGTGATSEASAQSTNTALTESSETGILSSMAAASSSTGVSAGNLQPANVSKSAASKSEKTAVSSIARSALKTSRSNAVQPGGVVAPGESSSPLVNAAAGTQQQAAGQGTAAHAAESKSAESDTAETFAAMDASGAPGRPAWIHSSSQQAEAGFQDPDLGWVGVRADASGSGIHAQLVAGSTDAAQTLSGHMAGLNAFLAEHHTPVETLTLSTSSGGMGGANDADTGAGMQQGTGDHAGQQAAQSAGVDTSSSLPSSRAQLSEVGLSKVVWPAGSDESAPRAQWVGGHISVMA
jgi:hypothetical protein